MRKKITWFTQFSYGTGNLLGSGHLALAGTWILFFYTTFCGLSVVEASTIYAIATYFDVFGNPIMGFITDNFYKTKLGRRFGRRRFFIMIGIPLMFFYPFLWVTGKDFIYYLVTYLLFEIIYTSVMIPYETLPVEMTTDFGKRTYLTGSKAIFGAVANFLGSSIPGMFFTLIGKDDPKSLFFSGLTYSLIFAVSLSLLYFNSWEKEPEEVVERKFGNPLLAAYHFVKDIFSTLRIKTYRHHLGMYLFGFGSLWLFTAVFTYFLAFALQQSTTMISLVNSIVFVVQFIATALFIVFCAKKGFTNPFIIASIMVIASFAGFICLYLLNLQNNMILLVLITIIYGFGIGGIYYIPWTTYAFMPDIDEAVTNRRREGIYAGSMTLFGKLVRASVVFLLGIILSRVGFVSSAHTQPQSAIYGLIALIVIGCVGLTLLGIVSAKFMKLNEKTHSVLIEEVERVHNGGKLEDVLPENKKVVEALTGFKYNECFGNNRVGK
ncbi:MFS transporter [Sporolactobacillus shoreicorticis]|uniref:MFS transporter n=1 Tax=Sporolactobacillus shoreicorticis TaxID=1923877 RepID=A0ABW5SA66_9BACL|nr:MFS transporter [Sporolactobacillus shoreicorticis]MCO7127889.1 MFS transporter [Sporolactobacillus shoreicorticis]